MMPKKVRKKEYPGGNGIRFAPVDGIERIAARAEDDEKEAQRFALSFSSEKEVVRQGWFGPWREVLGHGDGEVQMGRFESGRANMLEEHRGAPIGVIESAEIDRKSKKGRAEVRMSRTARGRDAAMDMEDETRTNTSVGYIPKRARLIEEDEEKGDLWRVTLWEPVELSLVGVPADETVGMGRSVRDGYPPVETEGLDEPAPEEEREMKKKWVVGDDGNKRQVPDTDPRPAVEAPEERTVEVLDVEAERKQLREAEVERAETIRALCQMNKLESAQADEFIRSGASVPQVTREILKLIETGKGGSATPSSESLDGLSAKDRKRWSFLRALRLGAGIMSRERQDDTDDDFRKVKFDGVEAEVHRKLAKDLPANTTRKGGILIPMDMRTEAEREQAFYRRTLQSNVAGKGAETIFDSPGEFIELLRSSAMCARMGARFLTGLTGPIGFVKQTGGVTVLWVGENVSDVAASDMAFGIVTMAQKTLQGTSGYTRQALLQSSLELDAMSRVEFAEAHSRAIDKAAIHGLGAAGQPVGIYVAPDVNAFPFAGVPTFDKMINAETEVAKDNAIRGSLGWMTTPGVAGLLMRTLVATAAGSDMVWTGPFEEGRAANYPAVSTTQVSATMLGSAETGGTEQGMIFGNWAEVLFGLFNTMELVVDPFSQKKKGVIEVTSFQMADLILRHGESFVKVTGATLV